MPGTYQVDGGAAGLQEIRAQGPAPRSRQDRRASTSTMAVGAVEETVTVTAESPLVDVTSKEIGGNITSETLVQAAERQRQLRRLRRPAARHRARRSAPSRSAATRSASTARIRATTTTCSTAATTTTTSSGSARARRRGRRSRRSRNSRSSPASTTREFGRTAGAVVNAVTKAGHQPAARQRVRLLPGRQPDDEGLLREGEGTRRSPTRSTSAGAAPSAARS